MITSRDNATLKLVRKLLGQRKHRDETGLFAVEGEDLVDAARVAGVEPVHLLVAGESVETELLAGVSTLPHPARAIGVYRRSDLPQAARDDLPRALAARRPGERRHARPHRGCVRRLRRALDGCADPLSPKALRASAGAIFRVPLVAWDAVPGRDGGPRGPRWEPARGGRSRAAAHLPPRRRARRAPARPRSRARLTVTIPLPGEAESLNVAAAGAIALYEHARRGRPPG